MKQYYNQSNQPLDLKDLENLGDIGSAEMNLASPQTSMLSSAGRLHNRQLSSQESLVKKISPVYSNPHSRHPFENKYESQISTITSDNDMFPCSDTNERTPKGRLEPSLTKDVKKV